MPLATLIKKLGQGGFGQVYKGDYNGEVIAVKVIDLRDTSKEGQEIAMKEINLLKSLNHPNIIKCKGGALSSNQKRVRLHIYMEFCNGGDLDCAIDRQKASEGFFTEDKILRWFRDAVKAVQYLHSKNIIHRDIKPLNILLHNDCIKIGDFGLAKLLHSRQDFKASVIGTVIYACPEILFDSVCDNKGDMWSLGCTLFQMVTLEPPFKHFGEVMKFKNDTSRLNAIPSRYSGIIKSLIHSLMQFDPPKRPSSTAVIQYLDKQEATNLRQRPSTHCEPAAAPAGQDAAQPSSAEVGEGTVGNTSHQFPSQAIDENEMLRVKKIPPATLIEKLGEGGFGPVYKGNYNGEVIEVIVIDLHNAPREEREMAMKEIKLLKSLNHPNIIKYKGGAIFSAPKSALLHIYMELCSGGDLECAIDQQKASGEFFTEGRILRWFRDAVKAVQYIHSKHIIHRNIQPSNILLHDKCIKLGNFGIAKLLQTRQDFNASVIGTVIYASPETIHNHTSDGKGDMWSLGCTLFQLAALEPPFKHIGEVMKFEKDRSRLRAIPGQYSDFLKMLINVLLDYDPGKRPGARTLNEFFNEKAAAAPREKQDTRFQPVGGFAGGPAPPAEAGGGAAPGAGREIQAANIDNLLASTVKKIMHKELQKKDNR